MWEIYDELIEAVPVHSRIRRAMAGLHWTAVQAESLGMAMTPQGADPQVPQAGQIAGMATRDVARWVKSWNWYEAAFGVAAINAALNSPAAVAGICSRTPAGDSDGDGDVFNCLLDDMRGKRVAVVGHFRNLERVAAVSELSILERRPHPGDFPDPACEYILAHQDIVVITATTLINKTLPRLLEISRRARVVLAGPSTPLAPLLFNHGIEILGGLIVRDEKQIWRGIQEGGRQSVFEHGSLRVTITREAALGKPPWAPSQPVL
jgi:uncharacterized protein (DUF4213/DUF364 family)